MVYALQHAGKTPTRAGLMQALHTLDPKKAKNPFLGPGVGLKTKVPGDNFPIESVQLIKWAGGATGTWGPFGAVFSKVR
jgi:hypothetical protein